MINLELSRGSGYIPRRTDIFVEWARVFSAAAASLAQTGGWSVSQLSPVSSAVSALTSFAQSFSGRITREGRAEMRLLKKDAEIAIREFTQTFIRGNASLSESDLLQLGITPLSNRRVAHVSVNEGLSVAFFPSVPNTVGILLSHVYVDELGISHVVNRRPRNTVGASLAFHYGDVPPVDISSYNGGVHMLTRGKSVVDVPAAMRGSRIWVTGFWLNRRGAKSPQSVPAFTYVP